MKYVKAKLLLVSAHTLFCVKDFFPFGLIDSHIVVCAIDREVLVTARNLVEEMGFSNLHGIVDSLWVQKKSKAGATRADYAQLKDEDSCL